MDPTTGALWGLIRTRALGRVLATIDAITGVATVVGDPGDNFAGDRVRHGWNAPTASPVTEAVWRDRCSLSARPMRRSPSWAVSEANESGEALAFNRITGLVTHASGRVGSDLVIESVTQLSPLSTTGLGLSFRTAFSSSTKALCHVADNDILLWTGDDQLHAISSAGTVIAIGRLDHTSKGLAVR